MHRMSMVMDRWQRAMAGYHVEWRDAFLELAATMHLRGCSTWGCCPLVLSCLRFLPLCGRRGREGMQKNLMSNIVGLRGQSRTLRRDGTGWAVNFADVVQ